MLASFLSLAQTSPELREALEQITPPPAAELSWGSIDEIVTSLGNLAMAAITRLTLKKRDRDGSMARQLDRLAEELGEIQADRRYLAALNTMGQKIDQANTFMAERIEKVSREVSDNLGERAERVASKTPLGRAKRTGLDAAALVASFGSKRAASDRQEALTTMLNHTPGWASARELLADLRGQTDSNAPLLRMINRVKYTVDSLRQDYREGVPKVLEDKFSRKLERDEWSALHHAVGETDILANGVDKALDIMKDPSTLAGEISGVEERLQSLAPDNANRYQAKAKSLAIWMVRREVTSENLLRNSRAIAGLFNEQDNLGLNPDNLDPGIEQEIKKLIGLYAYRELSEETRAKMKELAETEAEGLETLVSFTNSIRAMELEKTLSDQDQEANIALNNAWAGWLPKLNQGDGRVIMLDDAEAKPYLEQGYVRVGHYQGDPKENARVSRGYYQSSTAGRSAYRQGVAQSVHATYSGVNAMNGKTLGDDTGTTYAGEGAMRAARRVKSKDPAKIDGLAPGEYLLPIFDYDEPPA